MSYYTILARHISNNADPDDEEVFFAYTQEGKWQIGLEDMGAGHAYVCIIDPEWIGKPKDEVETNLRMVADEIINEVSPADPRNILVSQGAPDDT